MSNIIDCHLEKNHLREGMSKLNWQKKDDEEIEFLSILTYQWGVI